MSSFTYSMDEILPIAIMAFVGWSLLSVVVFMWVLRRMKSRYMKEVEERYIKVTTQETISYADAKRLALQLMEERYTGRQLFHQYNKEFPHHSAKYIGQIFSVRNAMESPIVVQTMLQNLEGKRYSIIEEAA